MWLLSWWEATGHPLLTPSCCHWAAKPPNQVCFSYSWNSFFLHGKQHSLHRKEHPNPNNPYLITSPWSLSMSSAWQSQHQSRALSHSQLKYSSHSQQCFLGISTTLYEEFAAWLKLQCSNGLQAMNPIPLSAQNMRWFRTNLHPRVQPWPFPPRTLSPIPS